MKMRIISDVIIDGIGTVKDEYIHEFEDDSNVFGRVLDYRQRMYSSFTVPIPSIITSLMIRIFILPPP